MNVFRILVTGGRDYQDAATVERVLGDFLKEGEVHLFHGGATGADSLAAHFGLAHGWTVTPMPADWKRHGRSFAGGIRNSELLDRAAPHVLIVFPGGSGTADMLRKAIARGVKIRTTKA